MYWMAGPAGKAILAGFSKAHISVLAKLGWGLLYGLGFGAGIGHVFCTFQRQGNHDIRKRRPGIFRRLRVVIKARIH